jgi:hypothetical protein
MSNLESKIKGDDKAAIEARACPNSRRRSMELGKSIEQAAKEQPQAEPKPSGGGGKDDVIDAEFKVKEDK